MVVHIQNITWCSNPEEYPEDGSNIFLRNGMQAEDYAAQLPGKALSKPVVSKHVYKAGQLLTSVTDHIKCSIAIQYTHGSLAIKTTVQNKLSL
jgi:hypothetical protein